MIDVCAIRMERRTHTKDNHVGIREMLRGGERMVDTPVEEETPEEKTEDSEEESEDVLESA